jgi:hypothetical protein
MGEEVGTLRWRSNLGFGNNQRSFFSIIYRVRRLLLCGSWERLCWSVRFRECGTQWTQFAAWWLSPKACILLLCSARLTAHFSFCVTLDLFDPIPRAPIAGAVPTLVVALLFPGAVQASRCTTTLPHTSTPNFMPRSRTPSNLPFLEAMEDDILATNRR